MQSIIKNILFVSVLLSNISLFAQSNIKQLSSDIGIKMLFPEGKTKAVILSFDDGMVADRRLVQLLNKYRLKGTFHLNSNKLNTKDYLTKQEIKKLFDGHEVSVHSANHPSLSVLTQKEVVYEVIEDRKALESLTGMPIRGMAYPFGDHNDKVVTTIKELGIEYARTVKDTYNFSIPEDFLRWNPSIHQFGKAYFNPNDSLNDQKEMAGFNKLVSDFIKSDTLALLDVWGHSWENNGNGNRWVAMENFFKKVSNQHDIISIKQIDLVDYINAYKNLKYSVDKKYITNLSALAIYFKLGNKSYKIAAGAQIKI